MCEKTCAALSLRLAQAKRWLFPDPDEILLHPQPVTTDVHIVFSSTEQSHSRCRFNADETTPLFGAAAHGAYGTSDDGPTMANDAQVTNTARGRRGSRKERPLPQEVAILSTRDNRGGTSELIRDPGRDSEVLRKDTQPAAPVIAQQDVQNRLLKHHKRPEIADVDRVVWSGVHHLPPADIAHEEAGPEVRPYVSTGLTEHLESQHTADVPDHDETTAGSTEDEISYYSEVSVLGPARNRPSDTPEGGTPRLVQLTGTSSGPKLGLWHSYTPRAGEPMQ